MQQNASSVRNADNNAVLELKKALVNDLITALENKTLTQQQVREAANYILDNLNDNAALPAMLAFLEDLSEKWSVFHATLQIYKGKSAGAAQGKEQEVINKLEGYIKSMD